MAQFKDREEYERWKAERSRQLAQKAAPQDSTPEKQPETKAPGEKRGAPASGNLMGIGELFGRTWDVYKGRFATLISLCLLMILLFILPLAVFGGAGFALSLVLPDLKAVLIGVFITVGAVISIVTLFWGMSALLCAVTDANLTIKEALASGWPKVGGLIWLLTVLGFLTTGGFLLFFIPGVIFTVWFIFGQFAFIEDDDRGMSALLKSREFVKGHGFGVFIRLFLIWIISALLGIVPILGPVLALLFVPFTMIYLYLIYRELNALKGQVVVSATAGEKIKWLGTATLGYVLVPVLIVAVLGASLGISLFSLKDMMSSAMKNEAIPPPGTGMNPAGPTPPPGAIQPAQPSPPVAGGSSFSKQDPGISGQAVVVMDGKTEVYPLNSGFFSETRMKDPSRAAIQFQAPAPEHSNARRIEITLDATRTGVHFAEGSLLSENFLSSDKIQIGQPTAQGLTASFRWVADGGQMYFPKPSCTVTITSAYSGTADGVFSGEVRDCAVHSAGIDHHISSVQFSVKGVSAR